MTDFVLEISANSFQRNLPHQDLDEMVLNKVLSYEDAIKEKG